LAWASLVPTEFDCSMRRLAYTYGKQLLPRQGDFESLYHALNLNDPNCPTMMTGDFSELPIKPIVPADACFVDPVLGDDGNMGGLETPMQTIHAAVHAVGSSRTVVLRAGVYEFTEPLVLGPKNSNLKIMSYPGETPVISGGKQVDVTWEPYDPSGGDVPEWELFNETSIVHGSTPDGRNVIDLGNQPDFATCQKQCELHLDCTGFTWHDVNQGKYANFCWGRLDGLWNARAESGHFSGKRNIKKTMYRANLKGQVTEVPGLQINGVRATRARYPNLPHGIEVSPGGGSMIRGRDAVWTPPNFGKFGPPAYYTDAFPEHARNESGTMYTQYTIGSEGLCSVYDPPVGYWCSEHPAGGGAFAFRTPSGVSPKVGVLPNAPYADTSEMIMNVWRPKRWSNWMFEVESYDSSSNNFTFGAGGNQGARGNDEGGDFFIENVFEEFDFPGEFFFNSTTGDLFLYHNSTEFPENLTVVVPQLMNLVNITGSQWDPVRNVTLEGLTFKSTRYTYMMPHAVPSAGDWALDRIAAVFLQGTENVVVQNSAFDRLDGNGLMISGYNRFATVQDSDFSFVGGNAIVAWGYTNETENSGFPYYTPNTNYPEAGVDGTDGNHPLHSQILRNSAREVGLYEKQSSFYMQAKTAKSTISGNVFFNGPRAGINFNDGFGGGDELSHNLVFSACRESGDHGPFNSWDRQVYLTNVRDGSPSVIMEWRQLHHNFLIDNYAPQEGVDNDDGSCYYHTHDNFMVYGNQGLKSDFGGHDNRHQDNIYAYVTRALFEHVNVREGHENWFTGNKVFMTQTWVGRPRCTAPASVMYNNTYFTPNGTATECDMDLLDWIAQGHEQGSQVRILPEDDEYILKLGADKLGIQTDKAILV